MINSVTGAVFSHTIKVINLKSPVLSILKRWTNVCCPLTISVKLISYIFVFHIPLFGFTFSLKYCCCLLLKIMHKVNFPPIKIGWERLKITVHLMISQKNILQEFKNITSHLISSVTLLLRTWCLTLLIPKWRLTLTCKENAVIPEQTV